MSVVSQMQLFWKRGRGHPLVSFQALSCPGAARAPAESVTGRKPRRQHTGAQKDRSALTSFAHSGNLFGNTVETKLCVKNWGFLMQRVKQ